jgi:hypothetical protein
MPDFPAGKITREELTSFEKGRTVEIGAEARARYAKAREDRASEADADAAIQDPDTDVPAKRKKFCYVGAPAIFTLESACQDLIRAFGGGDDAYGIYLVGSALERADWRDVDVRMIMTDEGFVRLFPDAQQHWEMDPRWIWMTVSISERLSRLTGLPIDFQFQSQSHANKCHEGPRQALGMIFAKADRSEP